MKKALLLLLLLMIAGPAWATDINVAAASAGGVPTVGGAWTTSDVSRVNDGDKFYSAGYANTGATGYVEVAFGVSHVSSVTATMAPALSSSIDWSVSLWYGGAWHVIATGFQGTVGTLDYTYGGSWSNVSKARVDITSAGGTAGGGVFELAAMGTYGSTSVDSSLDIGGD